MTNYQLIAYPDSSEESKQSIRVYENDNHIATVFKDRNIAFPDARFTDFWEDDLKQLVNISKNFKLFYNNIKTLNDVHSIN